MDSLQSALAALAELEEDQSTPKNVKARISAAIKLLTQDTETSVKVSRALSELEELAADVNMQPHTRTQIFSIVSLLEVV